MSKENPWIQIAGEDLSKKARPGHGKLVTYPVSYSYNGGTVVNDEWFAGYEVGPPVIPAGYELISLGYGLDLNYRPPRATALLRQIRKQP